MSVPAMMLSKSMPNSSCINSAPRLTVLRNEASALYSPAAMPINCCPCPGNRNTASRASGASGGDGLSPFPQLRLQLDGVLGHHRAPVLEGSSPHLQG